MVVRLRKVLSSLLAMCLILAGVGVPAANAEASSSNRFEVNQGWKFNTLRGSCTIGYNDPVNRISYTAAHCGKGVSRVFLNDASGKRQQWISAGTIEMAPGYDEATSSNDWAIIRWNDNVTINPNTFDRDGIVPLSQVREGQEVCFHGHTSHGSAGNADCGSLVAKVGNMFFIDTPNGSAKGNSGGPVYLPGGGLVGVLSGSVKVTDKYENSHALVIANVPKDGPIVSTDAQAFVLSQKYGSRFRFTEHQPDPGSSLINGLDKAGSSDPEGAAIGLVLSLTALVGLLLGTILRNFLF